MYVCMYVSIYLLPFAWRVLNGNVSSRGTASVALSCHNTNPSPHPVVNRGFGQQQMSPPPRQKLVIRPPYRSHRCKIKSSFPTLLQRAILVAVDSAAIRLRDNDSPDKSHLKALSRACVLVPPHRLIIFIVRRPLTSNLSIRSGACARISLLYSSAAFCCPDLPLFPRGSLLTRSICW
jgi:hypothetical protein